MVSPFLREEAMTGKYLTSYAGIIQIRYGHFSAFNEEGHPESFTYQTEINALHIQSGSCQQTNRDTTPADPVLFTIINHAYPPSITVRDEQALTLNISHLNTAEMCFFMDNLRR